MTALLRRWLCRVFGHAMQETDRYEAPPFTYGEWVEYQCRRCPHRDVVTTFHLGTFAWGVLDEPRP